MERLPPELLILVASYLQAKDVFTLLSTSRALRNIARDGDLWKAICFDGASLDASVLRSSAQQQSSSDTIPVNGSHRTVTAEASGIQASEPDSRLDSGDGDGDETSLSPKAERTRSLANWDPSYPGEKVDWYHEYVARHAPLSMNWLQTPLAGTGFQTVPESKGLGLLSNSRQLKVVSPLDDGSVCLWDISHHGNDPSLRGSAFSRSAAFTLSVDGHTFETVTSKAKATSTGVVECVSVDSFRETAYIAVQSGLNEVDLATLQVKSHQRYPFSISALSEGGGSMPLTVGTTLTLHIHDPRQSGNARGGDADSRVDEHATFPTTPRQATDFQRLLAGDSDSRHAPLFQPGPLSVLHLHPSGSTNSAQDEIYVAGRFPSILLYDRRSFPRLRQTLHSGARLCSMTSLPYSFKMLESDLMRHNQLSLRQVEAAKSAPGDRLVACGEYNGKGSLEIYGLDTNRSESAISSAPAPAGQGQSSSFKNRVSAGRSKLLSVATHGTRLVVSDSDGNLRWIERDGSTLVRSWNLNSYSPIGGEQHSPLSFAPIGSDVARKILPTKAFEQTGRIEQDEILVWTGERIGLIGFTPKARFGADPDCALLEQLSSKEQEQQQQLERVMHRAFERQADEMHWMSRFGF